MEVLVHVDEAIPYWLDEINKLLKQPGAEWGRGLQDEKRLAARCRGAAAVHLTTYCFACKPKEQVASVLGRYHEEQLKREAPSRNPRFGTKPLSFIIDHLLVEHVNKHDQQIKRNLDAISAKSDMNEQHDN